MEGRYSEKDFGKFAASGKNKYWRFVSCNWPTIKWACIKCGHEIEVNSLSDSITKYTKCEHCGHEKFAKEIKQREEMALYDD